MPLSSLSSKQNNNNEMINFYLHKDIQKHLPKSHNPNFEKHRISLPARIGIIGNSGSKKSSTLLNFIANCISVEATA